MAVSGISPYTPVGRVTPGLPVWSRHLRHLKAGQQGKKKTGRVDGYSSAWVVVSCRAARGQDRGKGRNAIGKVEACSGAVEAAALRYELSFSKRELVCLKTLICPASYSLTPAASAAVFLRSSPPVWPWLRDSTLVRGRICIS